ncbi:MAG: DNA-3-methyladenine glycosylase 2 family protein [Anaerolineae bacterium]|nr:DNA-3-methyladenine glycosylase 2 family protein [Anaerolineae bacterium]
MEVLTNASLARAVKSLIRRDPDLRAIYQNYGLPPLWQREPGFATLVHIILEQQVSLASARAAFEKLRSALGSVTPRKLLTLDDEQMKAVGFSRQKAGYAQHLAQEIVSRRFSPEALEDMPDDEARAALVQLKGIGIWTADCYLLMVLRRPDVWPHGDLALAAAAQSVKRLPARPSYDALDAMAEQWRPHRAAAARLLWHHYLSERARK